MDAGVNELARLRSQCIWFTAELITERTILAIVIAFAGRGETLHEAIEFLESLLNDRHRLRSFVSDDEYLLEGATESELDVLVNGYIPSFLKGQIEFLEEVFSLESMPNDAVFTEIAVTKRRKNGFI